jgi:hypothetical protein
MHDQNPIYDVAISFLYQDLAVAQALYDELSKSLAVFFFPRNQEELAGSDGLESMRAPFRNQSRLNVVLYRPKWGNTPWTGVEEVAIKESCLATSFKSIFFFVIEPTHELPKWLPDTHVRFNFADFSLEQAVGAIKVRVQERGGHFRPMTPSRKAEFLQVEENYQRDRRQISSQEGIQKIFENVQLLFAQIVAQVEDVNANGRLNIESQTKMRFGEMEQSCLLGMQRLGMAIFWFQRYANMLDDDAALIIREFNENAIIPPGHMRLHQPDLLREEKYDPDLSRTREYVWRPRRSIGDLISSKDLATKLILQFLDLVERDRAGKIKRKGWG